MKTAWITGSSSGIGKAMAMEFNRHGYFTILSARRTEVLAEVQHQLPHPENSAVLVLDLAQYEQAEQWTRQALSHTGQIDILINNGGMGHLGRVVEMALDVEEKVMQTNFWGTAALTKAMLPVMLERGSGQIWSVASILSYFGSPKLAAYAASKFAVVGYMESLQYELRKTPVHAGILSPGFINTNVTMSSLGPDGNPIGKNSVAQEKGMLPEELARKFYRITQKNQPPLHVVIGGYEKWAVRFKRYLPKIFFKVYGKLTDIARGKK
ncbi:MAG: SDR family NAD(P)-dependent oxidoreductase [Schleiferiaceae bacterium]|jgi:dehydrogenase/reductase SDR family protein 7B